MAIIQKVAINSSRLTSRGIILFEQNGLARCQIRHRHPTQQEKIPSLQRQRWRGSASSSSPPPPPAPTPLVKGFESPKSFMIGTLAGTLGSLAGMGGGFVMIPLMTSRYVLGLSQHVAHGTSLFAVSTTGIAGALGYGLTTLAADDDDNEGEQDATSSKTGAAPGTAVVELDTAMALTLSGMITARLGASATTKIPAATLKRLLGVFMLGVAPLVPAKAYLLAAEHKLKPEPQHAHHLEMRRYERLLPASIIGLGSGFLAGLLGVGGGAIVVPALALSTDMTHYQALGTSLAAMTLPAVVGTLTHYGKGNVCMKVAPMLAMGSFVGAFVGGRYVGLNLDEHTLRLGFSGLMVVLGTKTLLKI